MIKIGNIDFVEFLRFQACIMTMLLVVQALDYVFSFGVNNYLFVLFCIVFAFTLGSVYYNIIITNNREALEEKLRALEKEIKNMSDTGATETESVEDIIENMNTILHKE